MYEFSVLQTIIACILQNISFPLCKIFMTYIAFERKSHMITLIYKLVLLYLYYHKVLETGMFLVQGTAIIQ